MLDELIVLWMLSLSVTPAMAQQVSVDIGFPHVSIGINVASYPNLVPVPGYPVYYAPRLSSNYFFYDGMYWVYQEDNWYASSWYNGPWGLVGREIVPVFVLRVPVRYYRQPPPYFRGWQPDGPPRWGQHWGHDWEQRHSGWDRWNRKSMPARPPLPTYQRQYTGDRYPGVEQQQAIHSRNYDYQPRERVVRQQYETQSRHNPPQRGSREKQDIRSERDERTQGTARSHPLPPVNQDALRQSNRPEQRHREQRGALPEQHEQGEDSRQQNAPPPRQQHGRAQGHDRDRETDGDHGRNH